MDILVFLIFCVSLLVCIVADIPILIALLLGLILFLAYGARQGFGSKALFLMCLEGVKTAKNILFTFVLIGMLTALWRASGCIPTIVCLASGLIRPQIMILLTFLLCALVSVLTGTAFGTAATMGVICVSVAEAMGLPLFWVGGAMLSGVFFGDRCSPVSTSALLVGTVTNTDIYDNIRSMVRTALIPTTATCILYALAGVRADTTSGSMDVRALFGEAFHIRWICLLPAVLILLLAFCRLSVRMLMSVSIVAAFVLAMLVQGEGLLQLLRYMLTGYVSSSETLAPMINGGGIWSMAKVAAIVSIASCYSGIFKATGLLQFMHRLVDRLEKGMGTYPTVLLVAAAMSAVACNQTLAIMLTEQLTGHLESDKRIRAINLEDSAVIISPLIPWGIAGTVPLATCGAPLICLAAAAYLYLLPLWRLVCKKDRLVKGTD